MEEQNILTGNEVVLDQIIGEVKEYNQNCTRLESVQSRQKELKRNINTLEEQVKDAIEDKVKESTSAICSGYDKAIAKEKGKIKDISSQRDKAKMAGVRERIANETAALRNENDGLYAQIKEAFKMENISMICSSRLYLALFYTKNFADSLLCVLFLFVIFAIASVALYFIPGVNVFVYMITYFILTFVLFLIYKIVCSKTIYSHLETIDGALRTKIEIKANNKKIKRIVHHIKHDKNEEMYGLHSYDQQINELHDNISKVEDEKRAALKQFDETAKNDIIAEIDGRERGKINDLKSKLQESLQLQTQLENTIKEETIKISSKYETYLGKNMTVDFLMELKSIMKTEGVQTIGQALAEHERKH